MGADTSQATAVLFPALKVYFCVSHLEERLKSVDKFAVAFNLCSFVTVSLSFALKYIKNYDMSQFPDKLIFNVNVNYSKTENYLVGKSNNKRIINHKLLELGPNVL